MTWTQFLDMHSGGPQKEDWARIYIEAPETEAKVIFYNRFGHNPERVSCTCCGDDYSISEEPTLAEATAYHRGCAYDNEAKAYVEVEKSGYKEYGRLLTVQEYVEQPEVLVIRADEIKDEERRGDVPAEGYVWVD